MAAGHRHHVELAARDRVPGGRDVGDPAGVEDRHLHLGADLAGKVQMRRRAHAGHRDHVGEAGIVVDMAADQVQEIDRAAVAEPAADLDPLGAAQALVPILVGDEPQTDDRALADPLADRPQHPHREPHPVLQAAAKLVLAPVRRGGPEPIQQVPVGLELEAVEAGRHHSLGRVRIVAGYPRDVPVLHRLRERAVRGLAHRRGRQDRQPVATGKTGAPAEMGELDHHRRAMLVALVDELLQPRHDLVLPSQKVAEGGRRVATDDGRPGGHRQRHAALRPLHMVGAVAVLRHPVLVVVRLVGRDHQPVLQRQMLEPERLEQRVGRHGRPPGRADRRPRGAARTPPRKGRRRRDCVSRRRRGKGPAISAGAALGMARRQASAGQPRTRAVNPVRRPRSACAADAAGSGIPRRSAARARRRAAPAGRRGSRRRRRGRARSDPAGPSGGHARG